MDFFNQDAKQVSDLHGRLTFSQKMSYVLLIVVFVFALVMFADFLRDRHAAELREAYRAAPVARRQRLVGVRAMRRERHVDHAGLTGFGQVLLQAWAERSGGARAYSQKAPGWATTTVRPSSSATCSECCG